MPDTPKLTLYTYQIPAPLREKFVSCDTSQNDEFAHMSQKLTEELKAYLLQFREEVERRMGEGFVRQLHHIQQGLQEQQTVSAVAQIEGAITAYEEMAYAILETSEVVAQVLHNGKAAFGSATIEELLGPYELRERLTIILEQITEAGERLGQVIRPME